MSDCPLPEDHPLRKAWQDYNVRRLPARTLLGVPVRGHRVGSLWASFMAGWVAATGHPRRYGSHSMDQWSDAEKMIFEASQLIEKMGADVRLTEAQTLLGDARARVADYVIGRKEAKAAAEWLRTHETPAPPAS